MDIQAQFEQAWRRIRQRVLPKSAASGLYCPGHGVPTWLAARSWERFTKFVTPSQPGADPPIASARAARMVSKAAPRTALSCIANDSLHARAFQGVHSSAMVRYRAARTSDSSRGPCSRLLPPGLKNETIAMPKPTRHYAPPKDSLAWRVCDYLRANPGEELMRGDVATKFNVSPAAIDGELQPAVSAHMLERVQTDDSGIVWRLRAQSRGSFPRPFSSSVAAARRAVRSRAWQSDLTRLSAAQRCRKPFG